MTMQAATAVLTISFTCKQLHSVMFLNVQTTSGMIWLLKSTYNCIKMIFMCPELRLLIYRHDFKSLNFNGSRKKNYRPVCPVCEQIIKA